MTRVIVADDHQLVRQGIRLLLERASDIEVIGECENGAEAVTMASALFPDVLVMDVSMPSLNGLDATEALATKAPGVAVVILSMYEDETLVRRAIKAGAKGYVVKGSVADELLLAVRAASRGGTYSTRQASQSISGNGQAASRATSAADSLTPREREILALIGDGLTNRAIAGRLGLSVKTIERHRTNLMAKLDVHSVVDLVRAGIRAGVIRLDR